MESGVYANVLPLLPHVRVLASGIRLFAHPTSISGRVQIQVFVSADVFVEQYGVLSVSLTDSHNLTLIPALLPVNPPRAS